MNQAENNKATVRRFVEAINAHDWAALSALIAPDFVRHSYAAGQPGVRSREDLIRFLRLESESFPDGQETLLDLMAEGNKVAARHEFKGTQLGPLGPYPASGKVLQAVYLAIYRFERGLIVEAWVEWDNQSTLAQLGHAQPVSQSGPRENCPDAPRTQNT